MSEKWYYVENGERRGPVEQDEIISLHQSGKLTDQDYVWRKGFENWAKISDVKELKSVPGVPSELPDPIPSPKQEASFSDYSPNEKVFFLKTGADRGREAVEYGPFSVELLKKLYDENRINAKTFVFAKDMANWLPLGDVKGFEQTFETSPPVIEDDDRRAFRRKPFIARMFIENKNQVFEGICRDVSVGGMQVLVDNFPVQVGEKVAINAHPENSDYHFTASGEVVRRLEGGLGFSFRFLNLNEEAIKAINSYTAQE